MKVCKCYPGFKFKALTFSFDDGTFQDLEMINIMKKFNLKGTFNLNSGLLENNGDFIIEKWLHNRHIPYNLIQDVYEGFEIASHTSTHPDLTLLNEVELKEEITKDIKELSKIANYPVVGFAYPYGAYNDHIVNFLKQNHILYARTVETEFSFDIPTDFYRYGGTCTITDEKTKLIKKFLKMNTQKMSLFYIWGHSYELDMFHEHERIYDELEMLSNKDDIWYCTNKEVFEYLNAMKALKFNKQKNQFINHSNIDLYIIVEGQQMIIKGE